MSRTGAELVRDRIDRYRSMGAFGKPVYQSHVQLRGMLQGQRKHELAQYFATPVFDTETGELSWLADLPGTPRRLSELGAEESSRALARLRKTRQELLDFAEHLRQRASGQLGGSTAFASLLGQAMHVPAKGDFLYFIGEQPVIAFWGFEDEQGRSTDPAVVTPVPAAALPPVAEPAPSPADAMSFEGAPAVVRHGWRGWRWWWWLLLALLLALALAFGLRSCQPTAVLPPGVPDTVGRAADKPLDIPPGALERGDLSFLEGQWQLGDGRLSEYRNTPENVIGSGRTVLDFKRDGSGRSHFLERKRHGRDATDGPSYPTCSGPLRASTDGQRLIIEQGLCAVPGGQGDGMNGSRQECQRTTQGRTLCETVNAKDGQRWSAHLNRLKDSR